MQWKKTTVCAADVDGNVSWTEHIHARIHAEGKALLVPVLNDDNSIGYKDRIGSFSNGTDRIRNFYSGHISSNQKGRREWQRSNQGSRELDTDSAGAEMRKDVNQAAPIDDTSISRSATADADTFVADSLGIAPETVVTEVPDETGAPSCHHSIESCI